MYSSFYYLELGSFGANLKVSPVSPQPKTLSIPFLHEATM